jgi:chemotaxis protein MotB
MSINPHSPIRRRVRDEPEDEGWLITFADMSVLLMSFFVLLLSMSTPNMDQLKVVSEALRAQGFYSETPPTDDPYEPLKKQMALAVGSSGYDKYIAVDTSKENIEVELSSTAFFEPGAAKFSPKALPMLALIAEQILPLAKKDVVIEINGHTDDEPISTEQFPSNWELSSARAANIVRYLVAQGFPPAKLRAVGLADTQPKAMNRDKYGNAIEANQELNRRVVLKMLRGDDN